METISLEQLRYPIGKFKSPENFSAASIAEMISVIENHPAKLRAAVSRLSDIQLDTPYREGGWTIRQVVHHLADSHMNSYIRFKLALTEDTPVIKPYQEDRWAELEEAKHAPVEISLSLLEALHCRWVMMLKNISSDDLQKKFHHPQSKKDFELRTVIALYAWHCNHHLAHINNLKERMGW